ncbi:MAG: hypothetical protein IMW91_07810 [Firmicutes bacterium]|nr:hypothetical protein [Bacillota bacterium]
MVAPLFWLAVGLFLLWVVLHFAFGILGLLWRIALLVAIVAGILWLIDRFRHP